MFGREHRYIALKIYIHSTKRNEEVEIFKHLATVKIDHPGHKMGHLMLDAFQIDGPKGSHQCVVHEHS